MWVSDNTLMFSDHGNKKKKTVTFYDLTDDKSVSFAVEREFKYAVGSKH